MGGDDTFDRSAETWTGEAIGASPEPQGQQQSESRYEDRDELGAGSIGTVRLVWDGRLGREVAFKELSTHGDLTRFRREARITAWLEHPGIVPVHDMGILDGRPYYTMRVVRGRSLKQRIAEAADERERLELLPHFVDVCQAMAYAHSRGVIHRDLKPANIMVGEFGETQIVDWGLARRHTEDAGDIDVELARHIQQIEELDAGHTLVGTVMGTPAYMSPEQAAGRIDAIDEKSDVWSLGAVLFHIVAGKRPFTGDVVDILAAVRAGEAPVLPDELGAIAAKAMAKDPADRYDAATLAADVDAWLTGGLVSSYRYSAGEVLRRWVDQHRAAVVAGSIAAVLVTTSAAASFVAVRQQRDDALEAREAEHVAVVEARDHLATSLIGLATSALDDGDVVAAEVLAANALTLSERAEARGILAYAHREWTAELDTVFPVSGGTKDALWLHDDTAVAICGPDLVGVFVVATGMPLWREPIPCNRIALAPDGLVVGDMQGDLTVRSTHDGSVRRKLNDQERRVSAIAVHGDRIAVGTQRTLVIFDGDDVVDFDPAVRPERINAVGFTPDGSQMWAAAEQGRAHRFDTATWTEAPPVDIAVSGLYGGAMVGEAFVVGTGEFEAVTVTDEGIGQRRKGHRGPVFSVEAAGPLLATGSEDLTVRVWEDDKVAVVSHHDGWHAVAALSSNRRLFTGSRHPEARIWTMPDRAGAVLRGPAGLSHIAFSPLGTHVVTGDGQGRLRLYDVATGEAREFLDADNIVRSSAFSPDGTRIAVLVMGAPLQVVDIATGRIEVSPDPTWHRGVAWCEERIIAVGPRRHYDVYDPVSLELRERRDIDNRPIEVQCRGDLVSVMDFDNRVLILERETSNVRDIDDYTDVRAHDLSPDGSLVAVGQDDFTTVVRRWEDDTVVHVLSGHAGVFGGVAFSPDGRWLATGSWDKTIGIWDVATGTLRAKLPGHEHRVSTVAFSPDGSVLATGSWDHTVRLWDMTVLDADPDGLVEEARRRHGVALVDATPTFVGLP